MLRGHSYLPSALSFSHSLILNQEQKKIPVAQIHSIHGHTPNRDIFDICALFWETGYFLCLILLFLQCFALADQGMDNCSPNHLGADTAFFFFLFFDQLIFYCYSFVIKNSGANDIIGRERPPTQYRHTDLFLVLRVHPPTLFPGSLRIDTPIVSLPGIAPTISPSTVHCDKVTLHPSLISDRNSLSFQGHITHITNDLPDGRIIVWLIHSHTILS